MEIQPKDALCISCSKRGVCESLCPEAQVYMEQDENPTNNAKLLETETYPNIKEMPWGPLKSQKPLSKMEASVVAYRLMGYSSDRIMTVTGLNSQALRDVARRIRQKLEDK